MGPAIVMCNHPTHPPSFPSSEDLLNGHLLHLDGDTLPDLEPEEQKNSDTIFLPALSFGFYIFKDAKAAACM